METQRFWISGLIMDAALTLNFNFTQDEMMNCVEPCLEGPREVRSALISQAIRRGVKDEIFLKKGRKYHLALPPFHLMEAALRGRSRRAVRKNKKKKRIIPNSKLKYRRKYRKKSGRASKAGLRKMNKRRIKEKYLNKRKTKIQVKEGSFKNRGRARKREPSYDRPTSNSTSSKRCKEKKTNNPSKPGYSRDSSKSRQSGETSKSKRSSKHSSKSRCSSKSRKSSRSMHSTKSKASSRSRSRSNNRDPAKTEQAECWKPFW